MSRRGRFIRRAAAPLVLTLGAMGATAGIAVPAAHAATSPTVVALTFDNAWADQMTAVTDMEADGLVGTFYVPFNFITTQSNCPDGTTDDSCTMTADDITTLHGDGDEIGGKTVDNQDLTLVPSNEAEAEVCQGRDSLITEMDHLIGGFGNDIVDFAYPFADYTGANGNIGGSGDTFASGDQAPGTSSNDEAIVENCGFDSARGVGNIADVQPGGCSPSNCPYAQTLTGEDKYGLATPEDSTTNDEDTTSTSYVVCPTDAYTPAVAFSPSSSAMGGTGDTNAACLLEEDVINAENNDGGLLAFSFHQICETSSTGCSSLYSLDPTAFSDFAGWLEAEKTADPDITVDTMQTALGESTTGSAQVPQCTTSQSGDSPPTCYQPVDTAAAVGADSLVNPTLTAAQFLPECPEPSEPDTDCAQNYPAPLPGDTVAPSPNCWEIDQVSGDATASWSTTGGYTGGEDTITAVDAGDGLRTTPDMGQCTPVATPGDVYTVTAYYKSTVPVYFNLFGRSSNDEYWDTWTNSQTYPAESNWTKATFVTPVLGDVTETLNETPEAVNGLSIALDADGAGTESVSDFSLVNDGSSPVVVSGAQNPAPPGAVTYDVTVDSPTASGPSVPTGSVAVSDGQGGSCTISSLTPNTVGGAIPGPGVYQSTGSCSITERPGTYTVTASYTSTNSPAYASASGTTDETVNSNLPTVATEGPDHTLWIYWETSDAQWHGPYQVGGPGSTYSTPAVAEGPSGLPDIVAEGPDNSTYLYWETPDAQWHGPLGIGAYGSTYSAPTIAAGPGGLPYVAAEGPSDSLYLYWQTPDAQWHGPLGVGNYGSTYSAPAMIMGPNGLPNVVVEGPNHSTYLYWETTNAQWHGPLGIGAYGSTYSAPSIAPGGNGGLPNVVAEGPGNTLYLYWQTPDAQWHGPLGIGAAGSTYSAPSIIEGPNGLPDVAAQGSDNALFVYWQTPDAQWHGPLGAGTWGTTFGAPAMAAGTGGLPTIAVEGPGNTLYLFWEAANAQWYGPLGPGGVGSTFAPPGIAFTT